MKLLTPSALLAAALLAGVATLPFLPLAKGTNGLFGLEVKMSSSADGLMQVYYDRGDGLSEAESSSAIVSRGDTIVRYRMPLPDGRYVGLRFDPLKNGGTLHIASLRLVSNRGRVLKTFAFGDLVPANQIASLQERDGQFEVIIAPGSDDPQIRLRLDAPVELRPNLIEYTTGFLTRGTVVFLGLAVLLFGLDRLGRIRTAAAAFVSWSRRRPGAAIAIVSGLAVIASAYPVVFLGDSYVSPNLGAQLLYNRFPTLPGDTNAGTGDTAGSDIGAIMWQHIPYSMMQHHALFEEGELPLWDRFNSAGTPLLGQGQSMVGEPLILPVLMANGASWAWDLQFLLAKWLFAIGLGLLVLALVRHLPSALLVSLAAPFVGFFIFRINHPAIFSLCYAPWSLYCWLRVAQSRSSSAATGWAAGVLAANLVLMTSGTVKEAYMLLLAMNFSGACLVLAAEIPWRQRLARLALMVWTGLIFILVTAPIWITFLDTLRASYTSYNAVSAFQIQPGLLLGAFDELFYRPLTTEDRVFNPSVNFLILLGLLYFLATLRHQLSRRLTIALAASSLLPLSLAFGLVPGRWIVQVPFLANVAHLDNSFSCALIVIWPVLAGVGFRTAAERLGTTEGRADLTIAGLLLFGIVFAWIASGQAIHRSAFGGDTTLSFIKSGHEIPVSSFVWVSLGALLAASALLAWIARRSLIRRQLTSTLAILAVLGVVVLLWREGLQPASAGFNTYTQHPLSRVNFHGVSKAIEVAQKSQSTTPSRAVGLAGIFAPGWTAVYNLEGISGPDALMNRYYRELTGASPVERIWDWRLIVNQDHLAAARPFLDALNVRYYFDAGDDPNPLGAGLQLVDSADLKVYESPDVWPRAFYSSRVAVYDQPKDLVRQIVSAPGRPLAAIQASDRDRLPANLIGDAEDRQVVPAQDYSLTNNTTSFDIHAPAPGVVVLTEVDWPGDFRATINNAAAPVLRLNHAFKGVAIPAAGDYHVTFRYWPRRFSLSLGLAALGLCLLAASGAVVWWKRPAAA